MRLLILGGPRTGKTTLARTLAQEYKIGTILNGDSLISEYEWSAASLIISKWMENPGVWIIEGVQVARALRKWMDRHPYGVPCDRIYALDKPLVPLTKGQKAMTKGCETVYNEIKPELLRRGTFVVKSHKSILDARPV